MVSKALIAAALLVAGVTALPPPSRVKRDPNALVKFYIEDNEQKDDPRFYDVTPISKREPNELVSFYIEDNEQKDDPRFYDVTPISKREPNELVSFYIEDNEQKDDPRFYDVTPISKREPNDLVTFYIPPPPGVDGTEKRDADDTELLLKREEDPVPTPILPKREDPVPTPILPKPILPKRDSNSLVEFYIDSVETPDGEEST